MVKDVFTGEDVEFAQKGKTNMELPADFQINYDTHQFYNTDHEYEQYQRPLPSGNWSALKQSFNNYNDFSLIVRGYDNYSNHANPLDDYIPPGWNSSQDLAQYPGVKEDRMGALLSAQSPKQQKQIWYHILEQQRIDEGLENSSLWSRMLGTGAGVALSPTTWIPIANFARYAKLSQAVLRNVAKSAPGLAGGILMHNALDQTTKEGGNLEDFAVDSAIDSAWSVAFIGAGAGIGFGMSSMKMWNARKIAKDIWKGVELKPVLNGDGTINSIKAFDSTGGNLSAAEVDNAEAFANSMFAQKGIFQVPYVGGFIGKTASIFNPIVRGLNSPFETLAGVVNRLADHGLYTQGMMKGEAQPVNHEALLRMLSHQNMALSDQIRGLHLQRNGFDISNQAVGFGKKVYGKLAQDGNVSPEQFGQEIVNTMITKEAHPNAAVNEAAALLSKAQDDTYAEFRKTFNLPEDWLPPATANGYLSRFYSVPDLIQRRSNWVEMVVDYLKKADATINQHMQPIKDAQDQYKLMSQAHTNLTESRLATNEQIAESAKDLKAMERKVKKLKEDLQNNLRSNQELRIHVEDFNALSAKESKQLRTLLKDKNKIQAEHDEAKSVVEKLKREDYILSQRQKQVKTTEDASEIVKKRSEIKSKLDEAENNAFELKNKLDAEDERLQTKVSNGEVDSRLYNRIPNSQRVAFKDPKNKLKFRPLYESEFHMAEHAKAWRDTILNQTIEHTMGQLFGRLAGTDTSNVLKKRSIMIPDHILYKSGFLNMDPVTNVMNYRMMLGRRMYLKQVLGDVTVDGNTDQIVERLLKEKELKENKIGEEVRRLKNEKAKADAEAEKTGKPVKRDFQSEIDAAEKKRKKEVAKFNRQFESAKKDLKLFLNKAMGINNYSMEARQASNIMRAYSVMTRLGMVPVTQTTDLFANVLKHGFWPFIQDGILPTIKTLGGKLKTDEAEAYKESAAHAHLALNHVIHGYSDKNWTGSQQTFIPIWKGISDGMEKLASVSQNWFGTNYIENFNQRLTANIHQSQVIKKLMKHLDGTITDKDKEYLLRYGIDPEKWAKRMIDGWKEAGSDGNGFGGYLARYWEWSDMEAANKLSQSINRAVYDTIVRRGMYDSPFMLDNPVLSVLMQFSGWTFASVTRYLIPTLQQPDAQRLLGTMLMLGMGAYVTPLRRLVKGEDPIQDGDNMFMNAMVDGGVFSALAEPVMLANFLSDGAIFNDLKNDRFKNRTKAGIVGGPIGGITDDFLRVLRMGLNNNWNEKDMKRAAGLIPGAQPWFFRGFSNKMIESLGLPETYADAKNQKGY